MRSSYGGICRVSLSQKLAHPLEGRVGVHRQPGVLELALVDQLTHEAELVLVRLDPVVLHRVEHPLHVRDLVGPGYASAGPCVENSAENSACNRRKQNNKTRPDNQNRNTTVP